VAPRRSLVEEVTSMGKRIYEKLIIIEGN